MKKLIDPVYLQFMKMKNKLAFFPTLMATWGVLFGILMIYAEHAGISTYVLELIPALVINDIDTARTMLTTFIAGLISIMVFSFSMVMILLNQAASNFSPRLLPGLISNKKHQTILGIYLMSIFYCLIVLISIEPNDIDYQLPGLSVFLSIFVMATSLAAFIYFVHSISQSIQVDNILKSIYVRAEKRLSKLTSKSEEISTTNEEDDVFDNETKWHPYYSKKTGFIQTYDQNSLCKLCQDYETKIFILPNKNTFLLEHSPMFRSEKKLNEEQVDAILEQIIIDNTEPIDNNYVLSFKLITEIGVRAMSPGINDPGTAVSCLNYMTQLLNLRMQKVDQTYFFKDEVKLVKVNNVSFSELTYQVFAPLRAYCAHDVILVTKMLNAIQYLMSTPCEYESYKNSLYEQAKLILIDAKQKLTNQQDLAVIQALEHAINNSKT